MSNSPGSTTPRLQTLLLCVQPKSAAGTISDHVGAFKRFSRHHIHVLQNYTALYGTFEGRLPTLPTKLDRKFYDVVVLHYSNYLLSDVHLDPASREALRDFQGLKVLFLQDEYRQIDAICAVIRDLKIHVLFTCVPESEIVKVYPESRLPGVTKLQNLTGYVPSGLPRQNVPSIAERPIDVGYRSRKVPYWLGELGAEKWQIVPKFLAATSGSGLKCDISYREEDRLYGRSWTRFLTSCRSVLGTESGASVFDFSGELQAATERCVREDPDIAFEEIRDRILREHEGKIRLNQISPRCFEAAALRTAMVLYEGEYSGILEPERHYVPLRKDFSNIDTVVRAVRDTSGLQAMVDRTYREIALNEKYSYRSFIEKFDKVIEREIHDRQMSLHDDARGQLMFATRNGATILGLFIQLRLTRLLFSFRHKIGVATFFLRHKIGVVKYMAFRAVYWLYVRILPQSIREKFRPLVRRFLKRIF